MMEKIKNLLKRIDILKIFDYETIKWLSEELQIDKWDLLNYMNCLDFDDDYCRDSIERIYKKLIKNIKTDWVDLEELEIIENICDICEVFTLDDYGEIGDIAQIKRVGNWAIWCGVTRNYDNSGKDFIGIWMNYIDCNDYQPWDYPQINWYSFCGFEINNNSINFVED